MFYLRKLHTNEVFQNIRKKISPKNHREVRKQFCPEAFAMVEEPKTIAVGEKRTLEVIQLSTSSHNHGSVQNGFISNRIVTFQIQPFSTSMIMGERVALHFCHCFHFLTSRLLSPLLWPIVLCPWPVRKEVRSQVSQNVSGVK